METLYLSTPPESSPMATRTHSSKNVLHDTDATSDGSALDAERCWQAVVERDGSQDGRFFFGVVTTGVFCRPSCGARQPLRKNVRFFPTPEAAEQSGLRACKRCRPKDRSRDDETTTIHRLCHFIRQDATSGDKLTLQVLANESGLEVPKLRRLFKQVVGMTPRLYIESCRFETLKSELRQGSEITRAIYDAGFASPSRVYEQIDEKLGMQPSTYRAGGEGASISYTLAETHFGRLLIAGTDRGLCFVAFGDDDEQLADDLHQEFPRAEIERADNDTPLLRESLDALKRHLAGEHPELDLPLDVRATVFQAKVWRYLQSIPYGETRTYTDIARALGKPKAARAVGSACGSNPVSLAIPCHRVLRSSGHLAGYRWGLERKQALIEKERTVKAGRRSSD